MIDGLGMFGPIDQEKARALSAAGRAAIARFSSSKEPDLADLPAEPQSQLETSLAAHLKAKAEIEIGVAKEVLLHRPGVGRSTTYDRENLAQLDRAIAAIRRSIAFEDRQLA